MLQLVSKEATPTNLSAQVLARRPPKSSHKGDVSDSMGERTGDQICHNKWSWSKLGAGPVRAKLANG